MSEPISHTEKVSCIICQHDNPHTYAVHGQFGIPLHLAICKNCGLSYLNPRWNKDRYLKYYAQEYDTHYRKKEVDASMSGELDRERYGLIHRRLSSKNLLEETPRTILDIGSGEGNILSYFQEVYPETAFAAIEPSETCQEILRSKGVQVLTHDVDTDWHLGQEGKYDLIIMRHVLEHFMNPLEVLKKVASVLSENGQLYIAVPNALYLEESAFFTHWLRVVHTYYFNRISLTNLCHLAGLHIQWMQEGDQANRQELFAVVSRAAAPQEVSIDPQNFLLQQAAYDKKMRQEKMPFASLLRKGKRMLRKISS